MYEGEAGDSGSIKKPWWELEERTKEAKLETHRQVQGVIEPVKKKAGMEAHRERVEQIKKETELAVHLQKMEDMKQAEELAMH